MKRGSRMLINFMYKLVLFPAIIYSSTIVMPHFIQFSSWIPIALLSALFMAIGLVADEIVLPMFGNSTSTIQGSLFMIVVTWLLPFVYPGNHISLLAAAYIGLTLGIVEFFMHGWIRRHQTNKGAT